MNGFTKMGIVGFGLGLMLGGMITVLPESSFSQGKGKTEKSKEIEPGVRVWEDKDHRRLHAQLTAEEALDRAEYNLVQSAYLAKEQGTDLPDVDAALAKLRARVAEVKSVDLYPKLKKNLEKASLKDLQKMSNGLLTSIGKITQRLDALVEKHPEVKAAAVGNKSEKKLPVAREASAKPASKPNDLDAGN